MSLDHACFPHIVESALLAADHATLLALRLVSRRAKALAETQLFAHVLVAPAPGRGRGFAHGYAVRSIEGALPVAPWHEPSSAHAGGESEDAGEDGAEHEGNARLLALLQHTSILDVHAALPPTSPLTHALARIPTRRGEYHRFLAPFTSSPLSARPNPQTTYVQEYAVYMGSHWRDRTFYFEPPPGVGKYVVHLRYHVDRRLCELFGPAPSCERIVAGAAGGAGGPGGGAGGTGVGVGNQQGSQQDRSDAPTPAPALPAFVLIFSGSPAPSPPSVPTHGLAASQRRTVHTLLYELAAAFESVRALGARLTLVGVDEFVACLCGRTSVAHAAALFESKLALARREMPAHMGASPVQYLSHAGYKAAVGPAYAAETTPVQLY